MQAFDALPLAAIINGGGAPETDYFCVHGGLSPDIKYVSDINVINRFQEIPKRGPLCDLTWSDPLEDETGEGLSAEDTQEWFDVKYVENPTRGCGYVFGYSATREFLEINSLATIVRAHDVQKDGYRLHRFCKTERDRSVPMVVTVFSAPNYCDKYENMAACTSRNRCLEWISRIPDVSLCLRTVDMLVDFKSETDMGKGLKMEFVQYRWVTHPFWLPRYQNAFDHTVDILLKHVSSFVKYIVSTKDLPNDEEETPDHLAALPSDSIIGEGSKSNPMLHQTIPRRGHRRSSSLKVHNRPFLFPSLALVQSSLVVQEFSVAEFTAGLDGAVRSDSLSSSAPQIDKSSSGDSIAAGAGSALRSSRRRMSIVEHIRDIEQQQEEVKRKVEEADKLEQRALETGKVLTVAERVSRLRRSSMRASRKNGMTRSRILLINDKIFLKQMQLYMQNASVPFVKTKWQDRANECMPGSRNDTSSAHSLNGSFDEHGSPNGSEFHASPEFWNRRLSNASEETGSVGSV
jgi:diadenosine tetraphosphatase ApaH/serine/threonine PP2A family protein phosphatase